MGTGARRKPTLYKLTFEGDEFDGLEVTLRAPSLDGLLRLAGDADRLIAGTIDADAMPRLFREVAGYLVSWNREDENGEPVPATYEGLAGEELPLIIRLMQEWMKAITGVSPPLPRPSGDGGTALEGSIPMEPRSPNPAS